MLRARFQPVLDGWGKSLGGTYLGYQFGWKPLLNDCKDFYLAHLALKNSLEQLIRDEGKAVRRKVRLRTNSFTNIGGIHSSYGAFDPTFVLQCYAGEPTFFDTYKYSEDVWLSGAFRYWLPLGNKVDWKWKAWMISRLFGLNPTPYRVYKAIPWSWLVDWFSNLGDVIAASSSNVEERLAADYCYTMCHIKAQNIRESTGLFYDRNSWDARRPIQSTCTVTVEHKSRVPAGVFGPNVSDDPLDLTPTQAAILGALGVSR